MTQGIEETQFWAQISKQERVVTAILEQLCQEKDYPTLVYLMKINPQFKKLCPCFDHFKVKQRPEDEPELDFDNPNELAEQLRSGVSPNQLYENKTHLYIYLYRHMHNNNAYFAHPEDERNMIKTIVKYGGIAHPKLSSFERMMLHHILSHDANSQDGVDIIRKYLFDQGELVNWDEFWNRISDSVKSQIIKSTTLEQVKNVLNENNLSSLLPSEYVPYVPFDYLSPQKVTSKYVPFGAILPKKVHTKYIHPHSQGFNVFMFSNRGKYNIKMLQYMWKNMSEEGKKQWDKKAREKYIHTHHK
jgi:hypothetical protein